MRISKTTRNALQILIATAQSGESRVKGAVVAKKLGLTEQNTSKIVHLLSRGGFIKAVRGPQGGMTLAQPPEAIRLGDVVMAMERMVIDDERTSDATGSFSGLFDIAMDAFVSVLNQHTLADMVRNRKDPTLSALGSAGKAKTRSRKTPSSISGKVGSRARLSKPRALPK